MRSIDFLLCFTSFYFPFLFFSFFFLFFPRAYEGERERERDCYGVEATLGSYVQLSSVSNKD